MSAENTPKMKDFESLLDTAAVEMATAFVEKNPNVSGSADGYRDLSRRRIATYIDLALQQIATYAELADKTKREFLDQNHDPHKIEALINENSSRLDNSVREEIRNFLITEGISQDTVDQLVDSAFQKMIRSVK